MIKKLFTLLTLALLTMPLAWGQDFYLVGTFNVDGNNNWLVSDAYKFQLTETNDNVKTYKLTVNLPACNFKIYYNGGWYGTHEENGSYSSYEIYRGHNTYSYCSTSGDVLVLPGVAEGKTTFTFKYTNENPYQLEVNREPQLYIRGFGDWNTNEAMTQTSTGWTVSKNLSRTDDEACKFNFKDEYGMQHGWNGNDDYTVNSGLLGTEITVTANVQKVFYMDATVPEGNYIIEVNSDLNKMVINQVESKSLANIQSSGVEGKFYTVNEDLQVVYKDSNKKFAIARDLTTTTMTCPSGTVDFMRDVVTNENDQQKDPWQVNKWVMLDFTETNLIGEFDEGEAINANTLKGIYTDNNNYTIKVHPTSQINCNSDYDEYVPNVYCPANFYSISNTQTGPIVDGEPVTYWFMTPQPMEFCKFTYAMYYKADGYPEGFYMEHGDNAALKGGVGVELNYNSNPQYALTNGESYRFTGVIMKTGQTSGGKDHIPQSDDFNAEFKVAATNLGNGSSVITAVSEVKSGSDVVSVTYCDLAGRMSQKPFAGVNIIVTRYSDGTVKTTKAIK